MFEHLRTQNTIETSVYKGQMEQVGLTACIFQPGKPFKIQVHAHNPAEPLVERARELPSSAADVEHVLHVFREKLQSLANSALLQF